MIGLPAHVHNAAWLGGRRFFLAASGHSGIVDLDLTNTIERAAWIPTPHPEPLGVLAAADGTVITAGRAGTGVSGVIYQASPAPSDGGLLAELPVTRTGDLAATDDGHVYLIADVRGNDPGPRPVIIRLSGLPGLSPTGGSRRNTR